MLTDSDIQVADLLPQAIDSRLSFLDLKSRLLNNLLNFTLLIHQTLGNPLELPLEECTTILVIGTPGAKLFHILIVLLE
jgi:hypothetical protein